MGNRELVCSALFAFIVGHQKALDRLTTDVLGALSQDGTRVRASASARSFRGEVSHLDR